MQAVRARPEVKATVRILVVEDDPGVAEALIELLESEGYRVWHTDQASHA